MVGLNHKHRGRFGEIFDIRNAVKNKNCDKTVGSYFICF